MAKLDKFDRKLLALLQKHGRATNQDLAAAVRLSTAPCWRRVKRLEQDGVVSGYVALVDRHRVGLDVLAYVHVSLIDHHVDTVSQFDGFVAESDRVLECYSVSGEYDYLIRVVAADVSALEQFLMKELLTVPAVRAANTSFVLKEKKYTTALPVAASERSA